MPAPGRGFGSPTPRGVPRTVFGALDAGGPPGLGPAGSGWGTLLVRAPTSMIRLLGRVDRASHRSPAVLLVEALQVSVDPRAKSKARDAKCRFPLPSRLTYDRRRPDANCARSRRPVVASRCRPAAAANPPHMSACTSKAVDKLLVAQVMGLQPAKHLLGGGTGPERPRARDRRPGRACTSVCGHVR